MDNKNSYRSLAAALIVIHNSRRDENHRHTGMDAGIQAKDGNLNIRQMFDSSSILPHRLPSMGAGVRHPCRNDGLPMLVHDGKRWGVGMIVLSEGFMN